MEDDLSTKFGKTLQLLASHPKLLKNFSTPRFEVVYTNFQKKLSKFHRVKVTEPVKTEGPIHYYWIKVIVNKPLDQAHKSLEKQYAILTKLYPHLAAEKDGCYCCEPIEYFRDLQTLVTRECNGELFNAVLKKNTPLFNREKILRHCFNLGRLLKKFHRLFEVPGEKKSEYENHVWQFRDRFGRDPELGADYLTLCHNDFTPRNLFVSDRAVEMIDFVDVDKGLAHQDLICFCKYIYKARFNLLYFKTAKKRMIECFLAGYGLKGNINSEKFI